MSLIAVHLGIIDLDKLYNLDYVFYQKLISVLSNKFSFAITCGLVGNSFAGDSINDSIRDTFPLNSVSGSETKNKSNSLNHVEGLISAGFITPEYAKQIGLI